MTVDELTSSHVVKTPFPPCRYIFVGMGFFAFVNVYTLRVNLNVAIVDMVNSTYLQQLKLAAEGNYSSLPVNSSSSSSSAVDDMCGRGPEDINSTSSNVPKEDGPFEWDESEQYLITGSFYYGYITTQIIGGMLAQRFGGKYVLLVDIFMTSVLTLLTPVLTYAGGMSALIAVRVLEGVMEGVSFPSFNSMLSSWAPPMERSRMATLVFAGAQIGTVVGMSLTGVLGWMLSFYVFGAIGLVWSIMWFFLVYNSPAKHPRISDVEREYIESSLGQNQQRSLKVPWLSLLKSPPVYAVCVAHFTTQWGYYTMLNNLPQYFKHIMRFDIQENGALSGAAYLAMWLAVVVSGSMADFIRAKKIMSTTNVRKTCFTIGFIVPSICLVATGFVDCTQASLAVFLIIVGVGAIGVAFGAWNVNHLDLAPPYAGTLMGITNTLATIPGFVGTQVVSAFTSGNQTVEAWRNVFYVTAGVNVFGTMFYLIFGSGELQPWAHQRALSKERRLDEDGECAVPLEVSAAQFAKNGTVAASK